jgi:hypothetical protein
MKTKVGQWYPLKNLTVSDDLGDLLGALNSSNGGAALLCLEPV